MNMTSDLVFVLFYLAASWRFLSRSGTDTMMWSSPWPKESSSTRRNSASTRLSAPTFSISSTASTPTGSPSACSSTSTVRYFTHLQLQCAHVLRLYPKVYPKPDPAHKTCPQPRKNFPLCRSGDSQERNSLQQLRRVTLKGFLEAASVNFTYLGGIEMSCSAHFFFFLL